MSDLSFRTLASSLPCVGDRALLELAQGTLLATSIQSDRSKKRGISAFLSRATGKDRAAQLLTLRKLIAGQQATTDWLTELTGRVEVSQLGVARLASHVATNRERIAMVQREVESVALETAELFGVVDRRLVELEDAHRQLERRVDAIEVFDEIARLMAANDLAVVPWPFRMIVIVRYLASEPLAGWEAAGEDRELRERISLTLESSMKVNDSDSTSFILTESLDEGLARISGSEVGQILMDIFDVGLGHDLALRPGPLTSVAVQAIELASLRRDAVPPSPSSTSLELVRGRNAWVNGGFTANEFARKLVDEHFDAANAVWSEWST